MEEMIRWRTPGGGATETLTLGLLIRDPELTAQVLRCLENRPVRVVMEMRDVGAAPDAVIDLSLIHI